MGIYVQYGCSLCAPDGWLNFDASPTLRIQKIPLVGKALAPVTFPDAARFGDILKGLPISNGSADAAYCSHVLEHMSFEDAKLALKNTFRLLRPGGVFRIVLPDLKIIVKDYLANNNPDAANEFMSRSVLGRRERPKGLNGLLRAWIGYHHHLWMWDYESLCAELKSTGFVNIRSAVLGDSGDEMFSKVEDPIRFQDSLAVQCNRP